MRLFILIAILIIFLIFCVIFFYNVTSKSNQNKYVFLTKEEIRLFFEKDEDSYVDNMSQYDLECRKVKTSKEYINMICDCVLNFTNAEKERLITCAEKADAFLSNYTYADKLRCKQIADIPWKFALTYQNNNGYEYENSLPHTRNDIIFLSKSQLNENITSAENDVVLTSILIHEKVHIFQRYNKTLMDRIISHLGYVEYKGKQPELKRTNPDVNDKIYYDPQKNKLMVITYSSTKPDNINDVIDNDYSNEHPYEKMAYEIENEYSQKTMKDIIKDI